MKIKHSLRFRLLATSLCLMSLLAASILYNGYRVIQQALVETVKVSVKQTSQILNLAISPFTFKNDLGTLYAYLEGYLAEESTGEIASQGLVYVSISREDGTILMVVGNSIQGKNLPHPDNPDNYGAAALRGIVHVRQAILLANQQIGYLQYGLSTQLMHQATKNALFQGILLGGLVLVISTFIILVFGFNFTRRIGTLTKISEEISNGDYNQIAPEDGNDEITQLAHHFNSMTESIKVRERALEASERTLRATVENTPNVAIQWFDEQGRILLWNQACETIYGIPANKALGNTLDKLFYTYDETTEFLGALHSVRDTGKSIGPEEATINCPDGKEVTVLYTTFGIKNQKGEQLFVCMDVDITEQKQTEADLERRVIDRTQQLATANQSLEEAIENLSKTQESLYRSEKLASLGSLVAGVAHELNTPLGNALTVSTSLEDRTNEFLEEAEKGLKRSTLNNFIDVIRTSSPLITRNLARANELITSFKHVAVDQTSSQQRKFDLAITINEIKETLFYKYNKTPYSLEIDIPEGIVMDSYPGPLGQVITNLINNSLAHAFEGRDKGHMKLTARQKNAEEIVIVFSDDGNGIPQKNLKRIFDPFFTTQLGKGGSGLGLNIVHNIVWTLLGGKIYVQSKVNEGAHFTLELPIEAPKQNEANAT